MVQQFSARIYRQGINPCVDVPQEVSQSFGKQGYVPVIGTLDDQPIRATLVPKGDGRHQLFINGEMRKRANVGVGDCIHVALEIDSHPRIIPMPKVLERALQQNQAAKTAFEQLTSLRQREILTYLNWLKRPETLERNVDRLIPMLLRRATVDG